MYGVGGGAGAEAVEGAAARQEGEVGEWGAAGGVEAVAAGPEFFEDFDEEVFGVGAVGEHADGKGEDLGGVAVVEGAQGGLVARRDGREEGVVVGSRG